MPVAVVHGSNLSRSLEYTTLRLESSLLASFSLRTRIPLSVQRRLLCLLFNPMPLFNLKCALLPPLRCVSQLLFFPSPPLSSAALPWKHAV
jgi:hypothetical protein